nr:MAG TPA: hypothetical protein [Caudoviricetes sp.]
MELLRLLSFDSIFSNLLPFLNLISIVNHILSHLEKNNFIFNFYLF